jgi:hypothetical protein
MSWRNSGQSSSFVYVCLRPGGHAVDRRTTNSGSSNFCNVHEVRGRPGRSRRDLPQPQDCNPRAAAVMRVINCTGPEVDCRRIENLLLNNLLRQKLVRPDPLFLGLDTSEHGTLVGAHGEPSDFLYTIGPVAQRKPLGNHRSSRDPGSGVSDVNTATSRLRARRDQIHSVRTDREFAFCSLMGLWNASNSLSEGRSAREFQYMVPEALQGRTVVAFDQKRAMGGAKTGPRSGKSHYRRIPGFSDRIAFALCLLETGLRMCPLEKRRTVTPLPRSSPFSEVRFACE